MPIIPPGGGGGGASLTVTEGDGSPSLTATTLVVSNGSLTDSGGGTATIVTGAGTTSTAFVGAKVWNTAAQTISDNTFTALTFDSEFYDTSAFHAAGSARLTIPQDGYYAFGASVSWVSNGTGQRFVGISFGGGTTTSDYLARQAIPGTATGANNPRHLSVAGQAQFTAAQYIEAHVYQSSGGNLSCAGTANGSASFWIHLLGT
jgi:hypothetical protein